MMADINDLRAELRQWKKDHAKLSAEKEGRQRKLFLMMIKERGREREREKGRRIE